MNKVRRDYRKTLCYITTALLLVYTPLQRYILHIDGAARIPMIFAVLSIVLSFPAMAKVSFKRPITTYFILAIYIFINGIIKGAYLLVFSTNPSLTLFSNIFLPIMLMIIVSYISYYEFDKTIIVGVIGMLIYCVLSFVYENVDEQNRLTGIINGNEIALTGAMCFSLLLLLFSRKRISIVTLFIFVWIPFLSIMLTGSRMGFGMAVLVLLFFLINLYRKKKVSSIIGIVIIAVLLTFGIRYVMDNTIIGERLAGVFTQSETSKNQTGTALDYYGDRGGQYYYSWPVFKEHWLTGIGIKGWNLYSPSNLTAHSEYIMQYCENGIIGFILYLLFFFIMMKDLRKHWRTKNEYDKRTIRNLYAVLISVLFANSVLWTYDSMSVFFIYGLCISLPQRLNQNNLLRSRLKMDKKELYRRKTNNK